MRGAIGSKAMKLLMNQEGSLRMGVAPRPGQGATRLPKIIHR
jgi:hypothetical protein